MGWSINPDRYLPDPSQTDEKTSICDCPQNGELLYDPALPNLIFQGYCKETHVCAMVVVAKHLASLERNIKLVQKLSGG